MPVLTHKKTKILYIHVPKTGGTYIEDLFRANGYRIHFWKPKRLLPVERISPQHYHRAILENIFDLSEFDFIFATVRHPVRRLISEYKMRDPDGSEPFGIWALNVLKNAMKDPDYLDNHLRPQTEFIVPGTTVFRLEEGYSSDFIHRFQEKSKIALTVKEVERRRDNRAWVQENKQNLRLNKELKDILMKFYKEDFTNFKYSL